MLTRQNLGFIVLGIAYYLLIPGTTEPILHITSTLDKAELSQIGKEAILNGVEVPAFIMKIMRDVLDNIDISGSILIQDTTKSLLGTAETLWQNGNLLVAFLIVLFSVVVPALKGLLLAVSCVFKRHAWGNASGKASGLLSKWSMADVFVMALVVSFLAINASTNTSNLIQTHIEFETGFYYFLGYCLLSIVSSQLISSRYSKN